MEIRFVIASIDGDVLKVNVYGEGEDVPDGILESFEIPSTYFVYIGFSVIVTDGDWNPIEIGDEIIETPRGMALCNHYELSGNISSIDYWVYDGTEFVTKMIVEKENEIGAIVFDSNLLIESS